MWDVCTWGFGCFRGTGIGTGPSWVVAEMDGREFGVSQRFVLFCHSRWCFVLVPVST